MAQLIYREKHCDLSIFFYWVKKHCDLNAKTQSVYFEL